MAKNDTEEKPTVQQIAQPKESPMAKAVDLHAGLVTMSREGKTIHAHPTVVKEHEKNGWKTV